MAEREVINVTADTRQAKQNLNSLYSVLSDINKLEEKASKSNVVTHIMFVSVSGCFLRFMNNDQT